MKKKAIKSTTWTCDIMYGVQGTKDLISELKYKIEAEESWRAILYEKKRLEEELSAVRIKILKRCINSSCAIIFQCNDKLKTLEKPILKPKKKRSKP